MASFGRYSLYMCIIISLTTLPYETESKWVEDTIKTDSDWVFITRFCFLSKIGNLDYYVEYPVGYGIENMVFYYDVPGQWSSVYQRDLTCQQKINVLRGTNQFPLGGAGSQCSRETKQNQDWYVCRGNMDFSTARERWWFIVLTRCGPPANSTNKGMYLYYKLHMTNGDDFLHKEYSADEMYIIVEDIVFFLLYIIMMIAAIVCAVILRKRQLLHTTYKMYLTALTIWTIHLLLMVIAWGYYGTTGWEISPVEVTGRILQTTSNIIFMLMLILLAKGYTVVRGRLTNKAVIKIIAFINIYIVAMVVVFIWEGILFDPGLVLYYFESPPGYAMVTIILIGWLWFTKAAVFTMKHFSSKTLFYVAFYTFYTVWFWASPFVVLIAMFSMEKWTREKTVNGVQQFIGFLGHLVFLILTLPHNFNDNFPFHIRTTQISTMIDENEYSQADYVYSSSSGESFTGVGPNLDIFITSKSSRSDEDSNNGRLYIPLEPSSVGSANSIPSRLQLATLPPLGSKIAEDEHTSNINEVNALNHTQKQASSNGIKSHNHGPDQFSTNGDPLSERYNHLPPLQRALNESNHREEGTTLPAIRGTGLPSVIPLSAQSTVNNDDNSRRDIFRVD